MKWILNYNRLLQWYNSLRWVSVLTKKYYYHFGFFITNFSLSSMCYNRSYHIRDVLMQTKSVPLLTQENSLERLMELTKSSYIHGHINCKVGEYKLELVEGRDAESLGRSWKRSFQCMLPVELWMVLPPPGLIYDCVLSIAN